MTVVLVLAPHAYLGSSSDAKPTASAGSSFYETDTGSAFIADGFGNWSRTPPLFGYATVPIPLGERVTDLPRGVQRARDYTHLQHAQGTT